MSRHVASIAARLSLRPPQAESLHALARACSLIRPSKNRDVSEALAAVRAEFPQVAAFDRTFPSLAFALATGVGKTRLMGAFIAYLRAELGFRHFFVLAPNLTIYEKLIRDFTPNTPKYVFQGISDFAVEPPEIITGENYESGIGVRRDRSDLFGAEGAVHVNVFNIAKINAEVRGGRSPRIKRLAECLGESYFEYLSALPDLVLLMDESHRYRAQAGAEAINELRPVLGLELTATPFVERGTNRVAFQNVVVDYPLARALEDGFVKVPCVATRQDLNVVDLADADLERIKLEDGIRLHEEARTSLALYADAHAVRPVKPFMLIVARDVAHAESLRQRIDSDAFFGGQYRGKVIRVDSGQTGAEADENVARLLAVESADEPTEVVIHVNMLKEGWDVTNLYTIVPLRAANARTLVEQSIGRGLRLPYGRRTGDAGVDRLNIVAHDRFDEIVQEARRGDSILRQLQTRELGPADGAARTETVQVPSPIALWIDGTAPPAPPGAAAPAPEPVPFPREEQRRVARAAVVAMREHAARGGVLDLGSPEVRRRIRETVLRTAPPLPAELPGIAEAVSMEQIVDTVLDRCQRQSIEIPNIVVHPAGEVRVTLEERDLDLTGQRFLPPGDDILVQNLVTGDQAVVGARAGEVVVARPEDAIVDALREFSDVDYDATAEILYRWAGQAVAHVRTTARDDEAAAHVVRHNVRRIADLIHGQMRWREEAARYEVTVNRGWLTLDQHLVESERGRAPQDFRLRPEPGSPIRRIVFGGFARALHPLQKFQSDGERRLAVVLESDPSVVRWLKPTAGRFQIRYGRDAGYEPDFVVETHTAKHLIEVKADDELETEAVRAKASAARTWCERATEHRVGGDGKSWTYALLADSVVQSNMTLDGLLRRAVPARP